jgi:3-phenylpropionate/trans-cinnamate dioxygenase ferredoxin reductase subunit
MQYHPSYQRHVRLESVQNAVDQARTAAASMTGRPIPVRPRPWFWSDQYDMKLQIAGLFMGYNDIVLRVNPGQRRSCSAWYFEGRRLIAVDAVNDPLAYAVGSKLIALEASPDPARIADAQYELKTLLKQNDKGERK